MVWLDALQMLVYLGGAVGALWVLLQALPGGWASLLPAAGEAEEI